MLETIRSLPSASSITPTFDHMAVDTSWERKVLKKVTWLQMPGMCFVRGGDGDFVFRQRINQSLPLLTHQDINYDKYKTSFLHICYWDNNCHV